MNVSCRGYTGVLKSLTMTSCVYVNDLQPTVMYDLEIFLDEEVTVCIENVADDELEFKV